MEIIKPISEFRIQMDQIKKEYEERNPDIDVIMHRIHRAYDKLYEIHKFNKDMLRIPVEEEVIMKCLKEKERKEKKIGPS